MFGLLTQLKSDAVDISSASHVLRDRFDLADFGRRLEHLVGVTLRVAEMVLERVDGKRMSQHLWLFELAGRVKGGLPEELRNVEDIGRRLAPLALLMVDAVELRGGLPSTGRRRIAWDDEQAVLLEFEEVWYKRRFAKGSPYVDEAVDFAQGNPLGLQGNRYFVALVNVAYYLQMKQPELPILLPVNTKLATKLETTPVTLGTAITKAVREGILEIVDEHYDLKAGKARSFRVNLQHTVFHGILSASA